MTLASDDAGHVYVFVSNAGQWTEQAKLSLAGGQPGDNFGVALAIRGDTALIGAPTDPSPYIFPTGPGTAYVFLRQGSLWTQQTQLRPSDSVADDLFGSSVALEQGLAVIGAPKRNSYTGAAYVFTGGAASWVQTAKLTASDGGTFEHFGRAVALSGNRLVIGAPLRTIQQYG
jgi:hypothetical protein